MLIEVDKRAAFRKAIDDEKYEILKQLAIGKFVKRTEKRCRKKSTVNKFCRSKGKYTELDEALNSRKRLRKLENEKSDLEQYSRRVCLRIEDVPVANEETAEEVLRKLKIYSKRSVLIYLVTVSIGLIA